MYMSSTCLYSRCSVDKKKEKKEPESFVLQNNKKEVPKRKDGGSGGIRSDGGTEFTEGEMKRFLRP